MRSKIQMQPHMVLSWKINPTDFCVFILKPSANPRIGTDFKKIILYIKKQKTFK